MSENSLLSGRMRDPVRVAESHPCFGRTPSHNGRIHLPVAPACNLDCRFCSRAVADERDHPGVAQRLIEPEEAGRLVEKALELCPTITVVGVAGPGDALTGPAGLRALRLVHERWPGLTKCLSTNGLLLAERMDDVLEAGVGALTVTVSAVDPALTAQLVASFFYRGCRYRGTEAGRLLINRQLEGLRLAVESGLLVKVNTVLVPGINDHHVREVARTVAEIGVNSLNLIPLIPQNRLAHLPAPSCQELHDARNQVEEYLPAFRHCRQCRADAVGCLDGHDFHKEVFGDLEVFSTFSHG